MRGKEKNGPLNSPREGRIVRHVIPHMCLYLMVNKTQVSFAIVKWRLEGVLMN
jgi:hypothetical protein